MQSLLLVNFYDPVYDRDLATFHFEDDNFSDVNWVLLVVCEKEQVTAIECRLHTTTVTKKSNITYCAVMAFIALGLG